MMMSLFVKRTTRRYFGALYLFLACDDQALAGVVVGLAGSATLVLHLVAAADDVSSRISRNECECDVPEVGAVLDQLGL